MIRIVSFLCVGLMAMTILALYHISEQTRVARVDLRDTEKRIAMEETQISILQAQWQKVAGPAQIQKLAEANLGMDDTATAQLSSLTLLPRRGDDTAPLADVRSANATAPESPASPIIKASVRSGM
jgi:hypothetical protein